MRLAFSYCVLGGVTITGALILFYLFYYIINSPYRAKLIEYIFAQPGAVIGVPFCGAMAAFIVLLLRTTQGPIEFEALGFKFRGASGPIVMWVLCFLSFVAATKLLWLP
jgi:hypothetical protein